MTVKVNTEFIMQTERERLESNLHNLIKNLRKSSTSVDKRGRKVLFANAVQ